MATTPKTDTPPLIQHKAPNGGRQAGATLIKHTAPKPANESPPALLKQKAPGK